MSLRQLLPENEIANFVDNYYQRLPFSKAAAATSCLDLGTWHSLIEVLANPQADVMVVQQNRRFMGASPTNPDEARELVAQGYTLLVRHAEKHHAGLTELARGLEADFAAPVNIHIYCTPASKFGFSWHYDAEEVFIVQTTGVKEYYLRKNSVNPWPIEECLPADMHYEREIMPLMKILLAAGDWLYIPSGYWHYGTAADTAISLSIGIAPRTGIDIYDCLRRQILDSLIWRQRLPVMGQIATLSDEELRQSMTETISGLLKDLEHQAASPRFIDDFLKKMRTASPDG